MLEYLDLIGLIFSILGAIILGHYLYKIYCKKRGIDFEKAMNNNSYAFYKIIIVVTIFLYFLIRALLGY